jgi:hypothetical protein
MMKNLITNRGLAIGLTLAALLSEIWRGFLDAMLIFPTDIADPNSMQLAAVIFTLLFGGWGIALAYAWRGSQPAMIVSFGLNLLVLLAIPLSWLFFYCTADCRAEAGIFNLANTMNLVLGLLAAVGLGYQIFLTSKEAKSDSGSAFDAI